MSNDHNKSNNNNNTSNNSSNNNSNNGTEFSTVTLSLDDGSEVECVIIRIFPAGEHDYIALLPIDDSSADEQEVYLYRYSIASNGEPMLDNIASDEEYEIVSDAFDEELDAMEYEELYEDEDNSSSNNE